MPLPTNRQTLDTVEAADINAIAAAVNTLLLAQYPPNTTETTNWWAGPSQHPNSTVQAPAVGALSLFPFPIMRPIRITGLRVRVQTAGDTTLHLGLYEPTGANDPTSPLGGKGSLVATFSSSISTATTGFKDVTGLTLDLDPKLYWLGVLHTGGTTPGALSASTLSLWENIYTPKRQQERQGGLGGQTGLSALPATTGASDTWNNNPGIYFGIQTAEVPA